MEKGNLEILRKMCYNEVKRLSGDRPRAHERTD